MKERYQNPTVEDQIKLRLFAYNSNNLADFNSVEKVEIYFLDPTNITEAIPDGRRLVKTIESADITKDSTGKYSVILTTESPLFTIGKYLDIWTVKIEATDASDGIIENVFEIFPNLWYTTPIPIVYDFSFAFRPNKLKKGSKRFLIIDITPNVPTATDLARYYENLAISAPLKISIEQVCGDCIPQEQDLRLIVDNEDVETREKTKGFYFLDTTEMDCGIYDVWFEMEFGENLYISGRQQLQLF
jgi:hypothetical protein